MPQVLEEHERNNSLPSGKDSAIKADTVLVPRYRKHLHAHANRIQSPA